MGLEAPMRSCFQFKDMSILQHGLSVRDWYQDLTGSLIRGESLRLEWRLPEWIRSHSIIDQLGRVDDRLVGLYQVYHDCGKPFCREVDGEGRQHFPNHAVVSAQRWLECSDGSDEASLIADLIRMDMDVHLLGPEGVPEFAARPQAALLLATGLSELHSNAVMFGGIGSTGFKIKHKRISRLGARIAEMMR
jgi:hypothetical protein